MDNDEPGCNKKTYDEVMMKKEKVEIDVITIDETEEDQTPSRPTRIPAKREK